MIWQPPLTHDHCAQPSVPSAHCSQLRGSSPLQSEAELQLALVFLLEARSSWSEEADGALEVQPASSTTASSSIHRREFEVGMG